MNQNITNNTAGQSSCPYMTDSLGRPVANDNNSLTVGPDGPVLLQDVEMIDKMAHFDRERIPERVVHAKGAGAFGIFKPYQSMSRYTFADFLQSPEKTTKVFVRFSTVIGSKGSADTVRDPRGFAVKFYTEQGIYDIVGNDLPVFFIRDGIKFPDVIHSLKPSPDTNLRNPERFWDFVSMSPEATHMITWLYSDRGTIKNYARIDGFGVNTYIWVNKCGERFYIKYHWKTLQGLETITRQEAEYLSGSDPDIAVRTLYEDIKNGNYPRYELCVQIMNPKEALELPFDPLDDTKTWSEVDFPLIRVGLMTLNQNPSNFFAEVEQSAFCPGNIVPGVELSADKMLQGRSFSYLDTQRHRIGPNFAQLPVNRSISPVNNNQRDGSMTYLFNPEPINYSPNSLNGNRPLPAKLPSIQPDYTQGYIVRRPITNPDDFTQAGERFRSLCDEQKAHLSDNIAVELHKCRSDIIDRVLGYFAKASLEFANMVIRDIKKYHADSC
ncbi:MAG: catalase [Lachnospiraceae bacterium]